MSVLRWLMTTPTHYASIVKSLLITIVLLWACMAQVSAAPVAVPSEVQSFLSQHCFSCHDARKAKAGLRLDELGFDFLQGKTADVWKEVHDRVAVGEMPPDDSPPPSAEQSKAFLTWVNARLQQAEREALSAAGRNLLRRLNRSEYLHSVGDLLALDEHFLDRIGEELPSDGKAEGFDRIGTALFLDRTQLEKYLLVAQWIAREAIVEPERPPMRHEVVEWEKGRPGPPKARVIIGAGKEIPFGATRLRTIPDGVEYLEGDVYSRGPDGLFASIGNVDLRTRVVEDGYYRFRLRARVDNRSRTVPNRLRYVYAEKLPIEVRGEVALEQGVTEFTLFLKAGDPDMQRRLVLRWNDTPKAVIVNPPLAKLRQERTNAIGALEQARTKQLPAAETAPLQAALDVANQALADYEGPENIFNPELDTEKLPRLFVDAVEVEGPVRSEWPPASHRRLFFAGDDRNDESYAREIFARLLPRAYRRPLEPGELERVVGVVTKAMQAGRPFREAMRFGLETVLCSPAFLYLHEPQPAEGPSGPRELNDYELANRLSYFLWSSSPDDELFSLAAEGKLGDETTLAAQVKRMLADPKSRRLVEDFAGQWLDVREFGSIQPAKEYKDYDPDLAAAQREEAFAFFGEILAKNLPITNLIDSDFVVVNERLAKHYGIEGVAGPEFRRVSIGPDAHRGGVLGLSGLMTLLADGTRTLPMRRGTWVLTKLFYDPPGNPPPNAGEIQPNVSGAKLTVRQRLEMHRNDETCASCHAKLDPFGLALENYDAIGAWRTRANGENFKGSNTPPIDPAGELIDGRKFTTLAEYKALLLAGRDKSAAAFTRQMMTYALARPVGYADHAAVEAVSTALRRDDFRLQSLILAIALGEPFRSR